MSELDDLRTIIELASVTESRTKKEQSALRRVAKKVDREWNKQTGTNKRINLYEPYIHCDYTAGKQPHPKDCVCRAGKGGPGMTDLVRKPEGGWSRLSWLVEQ